MKLVSMTAYGFGESSKDTQAYACEIRTLNSRFLEVNVRLPRPLIALETQVINHVKGALKRGKVDVFIDLVKSGVARDLPQLDLDAVAHYADAADKLAKALASRGLEPKEKLSSLFEVMRLEGILTQDGKARSRGDESAELHKEPVFAALSAALDKVKLARVKEGQALGAALLELTGQLRLSMKQVDAKRAHIADTLQKGYVKRLGNVLALVQKAVREDAAAAEQGLTSSGPVKIDDGRLITEIAMLLDKADIEEELTRLGTHIDEFERLLRDEEAAGRKLDFLCQEMHREVNTVSNKLVQTEVSQHTIEMKQTVERIRQQVQNLE